MRSMRGSPSRITSPAPADSRSGILSKTKVGRSMVTWCLGSMTTAGSGRVHELRAEYSIEYASEIPAEVGA